MASAASFFGLAPQVVKRLREEVGWSVPKLALRAKVSKSTLYRMEKEGIVPGLDLLDKIFEALGVQNWVEMLSEFAFTASRRRPGGAPYRPVTEGPPLIVVAPGTSQNFPIQVQLGNRRMLLLLSFVELSESEQGELVWQA